MYIRLVISSCGIKLNKAQFIPCPRKWDKNKTTSFQAYFQFVLDLVCCSGSLTCIMCAYNHILICFIRAYKSMFMSVWSIKLSFLNSFKDCDLGEPGPLPHDPSSYMGVIHHYRFFFFFFVFVVLFLFGCWFKFNLMMVGKIKL